MMDDTTVLRDAAWEAHAAMLNRAMELEKAAKELRAQAWKLYQVLDPDRHAENGRRVGNWDG